MNRASDPSDSLEFSVGGWDGFSHEVKLEGGELFYRKKKSPFEKVTEGLRCAPDADRWAAFWTAIERIGVWDWRPDYSEAMALDGTQWSLGMGHNGRTVTSGGSNDYPGAVKGVYSDESAFARFLRALAQLTGVKELSEPEL